jgi:[calcium/calmodulin-dependent protein kinase] kinase
MGKSYNSTQYTDSRESNKTNTAGRAPSSNSTGASTPTNYRIGTVVKPSTPVTNLQYEVKETNDVKRNRVKLPPTMTHAKPTTGDWLKKRYIVNNYILLDTLGTGSYGEVRLCKDRTTDNLFAIKIISKEMLKKRKSGNSNETYFEDIRREIAIMKKLVHPNVLRLFEVLDDPNVNKMYLVLEYMKEGDLINVLKSREISSAINSNGENNNNSSIPTTTSNVSSLSDLELWNIFRQVVAGIRYLHYQNVVHGDIKPQVVIRICINFPIYA